MSSGVALLIALIVVAVISRILWPFGPCRRCRGSGRRAGSNRRRWGRCGRCGGSGTRRRLGARRD
jgi:hypothetical protein